MILYKCYNISLDVEVHCTALEVPSTTKYLPSTVNLCSYFNLVHITIFVVQTQNKMRSHSKWN